MFHRAAFQKLLVNGLDVFDEDFDYSTTRQRIIIGIGMSLEVDE